MFILLTRLEDVELLCLLPSVVENTNHFHKKWLKSNTPTAGLGWFQYTLFTMCEISGLLNEQTLLNHEVFQNDCMLSHPYDGKSLSNIW